MAKFKPYRSKLDAWQSAKPCFACSACYAKHDAIKHARCTKCNFTTSAMQSVPGKKRNKQCPNCARPTLKNEYIKPFLCMSCNHNEFEFFHSSGEYHVFAKLNMLHSRGVIQDLRRQVPYVVQLKGDEKPLFTYTADYVFKETRGDGQVIERVIDYKGSIEAIDKHFKLVKRIVERWYGIEIEIMTGA